MKFRKPINGEAEVVGLLTIFAFLMGLAKLFRMLFPL